MNILCKTGLHRPLKNYHHYFIDSVSGKTVFIAECLCGIKWLTDSPFGWFGYRIRIKEPYQKGVL